MPMKEYPCGRKSWKTVKPETLDKLLWCRISLAGLDHEEKEVFIPDFDRSKTTVGFSYVWHDIYHVDEEPNHGKISTLYDLGDWKPKKIEYADDRRAWLEEKLEYYVKTYRPAYCRMLPNCLEIDKIESRCRQLEEIANKIDPSVIFVQFKPPRQPENCYLGYLRPTINSSGMIFSCDSVVLNQPAGHKFHNDYAVCHWTEVGKLYEQPLRSLIDTNKCKGCVFYLQNSTLQKVKDGMVLPIPDKHPVHINYI